MQNFIVANLILFSNHFQHYAEGYLWAFWGNFKYIKQSDIVTLLNMRPDCFVLTLALMSWFILLLLLGSV